MFHAAVTGDMPNYLLESLADRELEVFALISRGLPTRAIAEKLHLIVKTIEAHHDLVRSKMNLRNTNELMHHAIQWVLVNG